MVAVGAPVYASEHVRMGCRLRRAASQTVPDNSFTAISLDTQDEDTHGLWSSGSTITIPTGGDGIWAVTARLNLGAAVTGLSLVAIDGSFPLGHVRATTSAGNDLLCVSGVVAMAAGQSFVITSVLDVAAASVTVTASVDVFRVAL